MKCYRRYIVSAYLMLIIALYFLLSYEIIKNAKVPTVSCCAASQQRQLRWGASGMNQLCFGSAGRDDRWGYNCCWDCLRNLKQSQGDFFG